MSKILGFGQSVDIIDSLVQTPQQQFEYITQNLDLTEIINGNGILYEYGFPFNTIETFGSSLIDYKTVF